MNIECSDKSTIESTVKYRRSTLLKYRNNSFHVSQFKRNAISWKVEKNYVREQNIYPVEKNIQMERYQVIGKYIFWTVNYTYFSGIFYFVVQIMQ